MDERPDKKPPDEKSKDPPSNDLPTDEAQCSICHKIMLKFNLSKHMKFHEKPCRSCPQILKSIQERNNHEKICRKKVRLSHFEEDIQSSLNCQSAINQRFNVIYFEPINENDFQQSIKRNLENVKNALIQLLQRFSALKFYVIFEGQMKKDILKEETQDFGFVSNTQILLQDSEINDLIQVCDDKINDSIDRFTRLGSGWILNKFINVSLNATEYRPCAGGTYIDLPNSLKKKKSLLNIKNKDGKCLIWCILAALYPTNTTHPDRTKSYEEHFNKINTSNISFPITVQDIPKIEKLNNIRINVYGYDENKELPDDKALNTGIFPRYISKFNYDQTVNVLLISNENVQHFVLIKSLNGLLSSKTKHRDYTKHCERCLQGFTYQHTLDQHSENCKDFKIQRTVMPTDSHIEFKNVKNQLEYPIVIVADFESILVPTPQRRNGKTVVINEHIPSGYAYKVISNVLPEYTKQTKVERHQDCITTFITDLYEEYEQVKEIFNKGNEVPLIMSTEDTTTFENATQCYICEEPLDRNNEENQVVRDHCHFTGKFRGAAHSQCNMKLQIPTKIPVIFHGLKNYDGHMIIKALAKVIDDLSEIRVLPHNIEKYTTISTKEFIFLDSCLHLNAKLSELVVDLKDKGPQHFHNLIEEFPNPEERSNLFKKGLYPYNYIMSFEVFE